MQDTGTYSLALKPSHGHSPYPHGQPHHRRMNNLNPDITDIADFDFSSSKPWSDIANIAGTRKTSLPKLVPSTSLLTSAPLMPYGQPFSQHLYSHRHRDNLIAVKWKTFMADISSLDAVPAHWASSRVQEPSASSLRIRGLS